MDTSQEIGSNASANQVVHVLFTIIVGLALVIFANIAYQLRPAIGSTEPPIVFHWVPFFGNTIAYGMDPYHFFSRCQAQYGDIFTFILLGKKTTVYLGPQGNEFILNGKLHHVNAEEIYSPLTTPVFGPGVVYDCPNSKLMEQKKFIKFGLSTEALRSYVGLIAAETNEFLHSKLSINQNGIVDVPKAMAELTLYTASRSLQGKEVRAGMDGTFAKLFHDLDMGFTPLNFLFPWAPLPQNRRRDRAQQKMTQTYLAIINTRRQSGTTSQTDMITNLMDSTYKDGTPLTDEDVAHIMIALLMAGQHSSSASISWILLRLATRPDTVSALYDEQQRVLGDDKLEYEHLSSLSLHAQVVKETLRLHSPIHSLMRLVKSPMIVHGTPYILPESRVLLAAPGFCAQSSTFFPQPDLWEPRRWDQNNVDFAHLWAAKATMDTDDQVTDYGYGMVSKGAKSPYLPFGAGRHRCIGEQFAYVQLQTILASIVSTFSLARVGQDKAELSTDYSSLFSKPLAPATVRFIPRTARCD